MNEQRTEETTTKQLTHKYLNNLVNNSIRTITIYIIIKHPDHLHNIPDPPLP